MGARRLGVLGGTFNPIHFGHLHLAQRAQRLFCLDQVYFVVASAPPHKRSQPPIPLTHRYAMVCLATEGFPSFIPSLIELEPPASPFSVHTMGKIARNSARGAVLYFIAGGDSLFEVSSWHDSEKFLTSYNFIFVARPRFDRIDPVSVLPAGAVPRFRSLVGMSPRRLRRRILAEEASGESRIFFVDLEALDISASKVRSLVSGGKQIRTLVPAPVEEYLQKIQLYGER